MDTEFNRAIADITNTATGVSRTVNDSRNGSQRKLAARRAIEEHLERKRMRNLFDDHIPFFESR